MTSELRFKHNWRERVLSSQYNVCQKVQMSQSRFVELLFLLQVPVSIADLGGTEIDLRFASSKEGRIFVIVAPVLRFADSEFPLLSEMYMLKAYIQLINLTV